MGESCRHHCRFSALRAEELQAKTWPLPHPGSHTVTGSCISAQVPPFTGLLIGGPWPRPLLMVSSRPSLGGPWKHILTLQFSLSVVSNSLWPHNLQHSRLLLITNSWSLHKLMSIESVIPSNHLMLYHLLLLLPSIFPTIKIFSNESVLCVRWPEYWSFSFSISPPNEYSRFISFRTGWFDLLGVQETLKSLQHHSSKASILQHSAFFMIWLLHPYMATGKTIAYIDLCSQSNVSAF